jgi:hypothetical protein
MIGRGAVGILILFLFFTIGTTPVIDGVHNWRTQQLTQAVVMTTSGGQTTGNVTLNKDLFNGSTSEITSITSTYTETPVATSYVPATKTLTISAMVESQTRTLTIKYNANSDDPIMQGIGPFLTILIFMFVIGIVAAGVFVTGGRGR